MPIVPAAQWMPDAGPLGGGTAIAQNVIPRTASSYGPVLAPVGFQPAAVSPGSDHVSGAFGAQDIDGVQHLFAGCGTDIFHKIVQPSSGSWASVKGSLFFTGEIFTPATLWQFAQFKNLVLACYGDVVGSFDLATSTVFTLMASGAPKAQFVANIANFAFLASTFDGVGGLAPFRQWWSGFGDPTNFPTPGTSAAQAVQSDYNDLAGAQGQTTGLVADLPNADGAVFFQRGIRRVIYVGPPDVFDLPPAQGARGCIAPNSIVRIPQGVAFLAEDGFSVFDGATVTPIGAGRVDRWFFENWAQQANSLNFYVPTAVYGATAPINRCAVWAFRSLDSADFPDTLLFYNWAFDRWSFAKVSVAVLFSMVTKGGYLANAPSQLTMFDSSNVPCQLTGPALAALVSTVEQQPIPGSRSWISRARPLTDGGSPAIQALYRNRLPDPQLAGPSVAMLANGECPLGIDARYIEGVVAQPAAAVWTHIEGMDVTAQRSGAR